MTKVQMLLSIAFASVVGFSVPVIMTAVVAVTLTALFAEIEPGSIPRWIETGSIATILGGILFWLLYKHLPQKDAQMKEFIAEKDKQVSSLISSCDIQMKKVVTAFGQQSEAAREDFKDMLQLVATHHDKQEAASVAAMSDGMRRMADAIEKKVPP